MASQAEAVSGDRHEAGIVPRGGQALALATLCTLLFLTFLDNTVVSVALGDIQVALKANVAGLQWVVGAYALTFASIMLACGMIGDELGRKKVMLAGAGVFCAGSVLCAPAPHVQTLVAGRAVMGLGAAAREPGTLSMLRQLCPGTRSPNPLLDLRFLRVPQFTVANIAAFCTYFATFAIFFFTALYLTEVPAASGYRLAAVFAPMTVLMIASSVLAGRWTALAGPRWSITIGCLLLAVGLFLTDGYLSPHPDYALLTVALCVAGIGIGTTVVPITTAVLSAVPAERSGMAASATNTSRQIGAVTGVAILGSLVYSQLHVSLVSQMNHLGVPKAFQGLVTTAIETGQIPKNTAAYAGFGKLVQEVIGAAYQAF